MAKYQDPNTKEVYEVGNPELNPELTKGRVLVSNNQAGVINAFDIEPVSGLPYKNPNYIPPSTPPVIDATDTTTLGKTETDMSELIKSLTASSNIVGEKETYRIEQEKARGIEGLQKEEADFFAQLKQIQADYANVENVMQEESLGRGRTKAGLAPITASQLRPLSIRANIVGALLAGTQGKLTTAQALADKAVKDKYAQAEADRATKIENLAILSKDPSISVAEKKRADAQTAKLKKEEEAEKKKKEDSKQILDWALKAQQGGATPAQAQEIAKLAESDNPDIKKATELYLPFSKEEKGGSDINEFKSFFPNVDITTPKGQQQFLDWKAKMAEAGKTTPTAEIRDSNVGNFLESKKGTDGYISASDYQQGLRNYIKGGGTQSNYFASFPQQTYLRQQEIDKLPASLKPQMTTTKSDLTPDQLSIINDAKAAIDQTKQRYGDWGAIRQQIIEQSKQQFNFDISPYI